MHQKTKKTRKNSKDSGKGQGYKEHIQYQISEKANSHPQSQKQRWRSRKTRQGIANIFEEFYEELYKGEDEQDDEGKYTHIDQENADPSQNETIPEFTTEEIQAAIDRLKKGKAKDSNGIRAEQFKICSDDTKVKIRTIFNEIVQQEDFEPNRWRKIRIQVIYKRVTGKILGTTFRYVAYRFISSCLRQICIREEG